MQKNVPEIKWLNVLLEKEVKKYFRSEKEEIEQSGVVEVSGKIIIEPQYTNARSFANGYAAVCNEDNLWGFLNDEHKLCIDYTYKDALYFNSNETCLVSTTENTVQLLHFMFE